MLLGSKVGAGSIGGGGPGPHGDQVRPADTSPGRSCTLPSWRLMANTDRPCVPRGRSSFSGQGYRGRAHLPRGQVWGYDQVLGGCLCESGGSFARQASWAAPSALAVAFAAVSFSLHSCLLPASPFCISPSDPVSTQPSVFRQDRQSSTQDFQSSPWTTESGPQSVAYFQAFPSASKCAA